MPSVSPAAIACLASLTIVSPASAQWQFDSWTIEHGLPQNSINDIAQTRDGYLWLATYGGLVRFDGIRFVVFDRMTPGVESQRIELLVEGRDGTLWAATEEGRLIRYREGRFSTFGPEHNVPAGHPQVLEEDDNGHLWVTSQTLVAKVDGTHVTTYSAADFGGLVAPPRGYLMREVWWTQTGGGLHVLVKGRVVTYAIGTAPAISATGVNRDHAGNLWVRTSGAGVLRLRDGRVERLTTVDGLLSNTPTGQFHSDRHDNVWYTDSDNRFYRIKGGTHELIGDGALQVALDDREGSTWLGTGSAGLQRMRDVAITLLTTRDGLSGNWVYTILQSKTGAIWIGTWNGGVNRYEHGRFSSYSVAQGLPSASVSGLHEDRSGRLWIGTSEGVCYLEDGRVRRYDDGSELIRGNVWVVYQDTAGRLWFGTDAGLVQLADGRLKRFTSSDGLSHDRITSIFEDRSGALWIGAFEGLTRFADGRFTRYTEREGLIGMHVRAIHQDSDGVLWIGTYDSGLYRLAGERLVRFTKNEGLYDNGVFQILEDDAGFFWTGSNRGISRISRRELNEVAEGRSRSITPVVFGTKDGLLSAETNGGRQPAGLKTPDGRLWFPTMGGVAIIDPSAIRVADAPTTIIEEFHIDGRPINLAETIVVQSEAPNFVIRYTAPSFIKPEMLRFRYRLDGLDETWVDAGSTRTAMFRRAPPGTYVFRVIAASHDGMWSTSGQSIRVIVLPPFWQTWWFLGLSVGSVIALALLGHEIRLRGIRREHARQAAFSRQLIESQEGERRRIAREMHDSLGQHLAIIRRRARTGQERWENEEVGRELEEIAGVADRIDADVKEIAYGLRPHQLDTIGLSKTLDRMIHRVAGASGIEHVANVQAIDDVVPSAAHIHVYRIVQECLNNVIKHSKAERVNVTVGVTAGVLEIAVEDNGVGFPPEVARDPAASMQGFGLMGLRERARILGGEVSISSTPGHGTSVRVSVVLRPNA